LIDRLREIALYQKVMRLSDLFATRLLRSALLASLVLPPSWGQFRWKASDPLVTAKDANDDHYFSIKDPSIVRDKGRWHVFCTVRGQKRSHQIEYVSFRDWPDAGKADRAMLKLTDGYFCAPQVFYFRPHKKWYMIYQIADQTRKPALQPAFSTTTDLSKPESWTKPALLFAEAPKITTGWIDFWVICDDRKAHLFYTTLKGEMWRAETALGQFPGGWGEPKLALRDDIYEASHTYRIKGKQEYWTIVEAIGEANRRYFKAYAANSLEGEWKPLAASRENPFASPVNVTFAGERWSDSFSHGEFVRDSNDETLPINPPKLQFIFQGVPDPERQASKAYGQIPWRLGLLTAEGVK
jgi:hypothetical protein